MVAHAIVTLKPFTSFPISFHIGFHSAFKSSKNLFIYTCFSRVIIVFHQNIQNIFVSMQRYLVSCKNKKPRLLRIGVSVVVIKSLLLYHSFRHNSPDSYEHLLIRFIKIICAKSCHHFNLLKFVVTKL